jgi:HK97 family phage major capsid protein
MKKLAEFKQERASKIDAQNALIAERKKSADGIFSEDQKTRFNDLQAEIESLDGKIEEEERVIAAEKRAAALSGAPVNSSQEDPEERKIKEAASVAKAIRTVTRGGKLEGAEKEMNDLAIEESRRSGVRIDDNALLHIPMSMLRATAQTVSEDSGLYGGKLVQDHAPRVQMPFAPKTVLEQLGATRLTGLTGGDVPLPSGNNYDFAWLSETAAITPQKQQFDGPVLSPNRLGAAVEISNRLLIQSSVNVEQMIRNLLFQGYDRAINQAAINGPGTGNTPEGVLNNANVQQSADYTAATAAERGMIVELAALIEAANASEESLAFLMSPALKAILQNAKADAGSGIFLMPGKDGLMGYNAVSSTLVPTLTGTPDTQALIFGDWSQMYIGEWGSMSVLSDPYSASLSNSVRLVVNGHADVAIAKPEAFAVNKFITG